MFLACSLLHEVVVTSPTIGSNVEEVRAFHSFSFVCGADIYPATKVVFKNMHFLMWDIGGQDALRESWSTYYAGARV